MSLQCGRMHLQDLDSNMSGVYTSTFSWYQTCNMSNVVGFPPIHNTIQELYARTRIVETRGAEILASVLCLNESLRVQKAQQLRVWIPSDELRNICGNSELVSIKVVKMFDNNRTAAELSSFIKIEFGQNMTYFTLRRSDCLAKDYFFNQEIFLIRIIKKIKPTARAKRNDKGGTQATDTASRSSMTRMEVADEVVPIPAEPLVRVQNGNSNRPQEAVTISVIQENLPEEMPILDIRGIDLDGDWDDTENSANNRGSADGTPAVSMAPAAL